VFRRPVFNNSGTLAGFCRSCLRRPEFNNSGSAESARSTRAKPARNTSFWPLPDLDGPCFAGRNLIIPAVRRARGQRVPSLPETLVSGRSRTLTVRVSQAGILMFPARSRTLTVRVSQEYEFALSIGFCDCALKSGSARFLPRHTCKRSNRQGPSVHGHEFYQLKYRSRHRNHIRIRPQIEWRHSPSRKRNRLLF